MSTAGVPTIALKPPKPSVLPQRKREDICPSCDKRILPTGECAGCTGS